MRRWTAPPIARSCGLFLAGVLTVLACGCATFSRPRRIPEVTPPDADDALIEEILRTFAERDAALHNFKTKVRFKLESPDLEKAESLPGSMAFERPDKLRLQAHRTILGIDAFDLISRGKEFYLSVPREKKVFYEKEGVAVEGMPFSVSPVDIVRELFVPEEWASVPAARVRILSRSADETTMGVYYNFRLKRKMVVTLDRYSIVRSERYGDDGSLLAVSELDRYEERDGQWLPMRLSISYPRDATSLTLTLDNLAANRDLNPQMFKFPWQTTGS